MIPEFLQLTVWGEEATQLMLLIISAMSLVWPGEATKTTLTLTSSKTKLGSILTFMPPGPWPFSNLSKWSLKESRSHKSQSPCSPKIRHGETERSNFPKQYSSKEAISNFKTKKGSTELLPIKSSDWNMLQLSSSRTSLFKTVKLWELLQLLMKR